MNRLSNYLLSLYYNKKLLMVIIFLLSCLFSVIFLSFFKDIGPAGHRIPGPDYLECYAPMAENIINGKSIIVNGDNTSENYVRCAPGYPLILVPIFYLSSLTSLNSLSIVTFLNIIFAALTSVILFFLAEYIFNKRIALLSSFLWMSYPFNQWLIKNPNTEMPFIFLLVLSLFLYVSFIKNKKNVYVLLFVGLTLGFASLIRPIGIFVSLFLAVLIFFIVKSSSRVKIIMILLILLGNVIIIGPWELYVFSKTGNFIPLSSVGPIAIKSGFSFGINPGEGGDQFKSPKDVMDFMKGVNSSPVIDHSYGEVFSIITKEAIKYPIAFIKIVLIKIVRSWYATSQMWFEDKVMFIQIPYIISALFGVVWGIRLYKDKISYMILLLVVIVYFWAITSLTFSIMRYMIPVMSLVMVFSSIAIDQLLINNFLKRVTKNE